MHSPSGRHAEERVRVARVNEASSLGSAPDVVLRSGDSGAESGLRRLAEDGSHARLRVVQDVHLEALRREE